MPVRCCSVRWMAAHFGSNSPKVTATNVTAVNAITVAMSSLTISDRRGSRRKQELAAGPWRVPRSNPGPEMPS